MMKQLLTSLFIVVTIWILGMLVLGKINRYMRPMPAMQRQISAYSNPVMVEIDNRNVAVDKSSYILFYFKDPVIPQYLGVSLNIRTNAEGGLKLYDTGFIPTEADGAMQYGAIVYANKPGKYRVWIEKLDYKGLAIDRPYEYIVEVKP